MYSRNRHETHTVPHDLRVGHLYTCFKEAAGRNRLAELICRKLYFWPVVSPRWFSPRQHLAHWPKMLRGVVVRVRRGYLWIKILQEHAFWRLRHMISLSMHTFSGLSISLWPTLSKPTTARAALRLLVNFHLVIGVDNIATECGCWCLLVPRKKGGRGECR